MVELCWSSMVLKLFLSFKGLNVRSCQLRKCLKCCWVEKFLIGIIQSFYRRICCRWLWAIYLIVRTNRLHFSKSIRLAKTPFQKVKYRTIASSLKRLAMTSRLVTSKQISSRMNSRTKARIGKKTRMGNGLTVRKWRLFVSVSASTKLSLSQKTSRSSLLRISSLSQI